MIILGKNSARMKLRAITRDDGRALGEYFASLSEDTRRRFGPHPLSTDYAEALCTSEENLYATVPNLEEASEMLGRQAVRLVLESLENPLNKAPNEDQETSTNPENLGEAKAFETNFSQGRPLSLGGYFILEPRPASEEIERFAKVDIDIARGKHLRFAPSIADRYQNSGFASKVMVEVIEMAKNAGAHSIVLMGGTQSTNTLAVAFYKKFGFRHVTSYWTDIENYDMYLPLSV